MKAKQFLEKLDSLLEPCEQGNIGPMGAVCVGSISDVLKYNNDRSFIYPCNLTVFDNFFEDIFAFPLTKETYDRVLKCAYNYSAVKRALDDENHIINELLANPWIQSEVALVILVNYVWEKQREIKNFPVSYYNEMASKRLYCITQINDKIDDKLGDLKHRQSSPKFWDNDCNLRKKIDKLETLQRELNKSKKTLEDKNSSIAQQIETINALLESRKIEMLGESLTKQTQNHDSLFEFLESPPRATAFTPSNRIDSIFFSELEQLNINFIKEAQQVLQDFDRNIAGAFSDAYSYYPSDIKIARHVNPFIRFINLLLNLLKAQEIYTDTEKVIIDGQGNYNATI